MKKNLSFFRKKKQKIENSIIYGTSDRGQEEHYFIIIIIKSEVWKQALHDLPTFRRCTSAGFLSRSIFLYQKEKSVIFFYKIDNSMNNKYYLKQKVKIFQLNFQRAPELLTAQACRRYVLKPGTDWKRVLHREGEKKQGFFDNWFSMTACAQSDFKIAKSHSGNYYRRSPGKKSTTSPGDPNLADRRRQ